MSAILSADDLNDFISPGVACIKPVETLPVQKAADNVSEYEVTTEDKAALQNAAPASISLTDCLACAGCVTSAEAVLVSLQSHREVLDTLDEYAELPLRWHCERQEDGAISQDTECKIFVASLSPQSRASLAATYNVTEREASNMIAQLLSGPYGLRSGGKKKSGFTWIVDTNVMRTACLVAAAEEVQQLLSGQDAPKKPILTSACPGWICYAEKKHPHLLPHLSKLKSPQAVTGTLLKSVLSQRLGIRPDQIWHMAVMPCFDKKLEAARSELTSEAWAGEGGIRDVDCVITGRELLMLAESRNISFPCLPRGPLSKNSTPHFPDADIEQWLFGRSRGTKRKRHEEPAAAGTSGGYLWHVLQTQRIAHPGSAISVHRGRNADVNEYTVTTPDGAEVFKAARYYGFRNILNLVRRLEPAKISRFPGASRRPGAARKPGGGTAGAGDSDYAYVEVMACPGGCTNGGGQIKVGDVATLRQQRFSTMSADSGVSNGGDHEIIPPQKEWLAKVDEAYWSADSEDLDSEANAEGDVGMEDAEHAGDEGEVIDGIDHAYAWRMLAHWSSVTGVALDRLVYTTYRKVESDVGKTAGDMERVTGLAAAAGGGW